MGRMKQIRLNYKNGRMTFEDLEWMMDTVEQQHQTIGDLKQKSRFKSFMSMATENLELMEKVKRLEDIEKRYDAMLKAK